MFCVDYPVQEFFILSPSPLHDLKIFKKIVKLCINRFLGTLNTDLTLILLVEAYQICQCLLLELRMSIHEQRVGNRGAIFLESRKCVGNQGAKFLEGILFSVKLVLWWNFSTLPPFPSLRFSGYATDITFTCTAKF